MRVNNKSTHIQYKQASASGPYPEGRLLTPPPQPPWQKCVLAWLGSTALGTRDALTTQTVGLPACSVMVSTGHF